MDVSCYALRPESIEVRFPNKNEDGSFSAYPHLVIRGVDGDCVVTFWESYGVLAEELLRASRVAEGSSKLCGEG